MTQDLKNIINLKKKLSTTYENTWCPGCPNYGIMEATKQAIARLILQGLKKENFAMSTGIGCHGKIFDYLNISGLYTLHGRVLPTCLGMKLGNPNLKVIGFGGDGDTYSEGIAHFVHACRYNSDITMIVHNNQSFSLTTGQATPTSQQGFKTKAEPFGAFNNPLNPIKLALACGVGFVARTNARNIPHMTKIIETAIKHNGFSFVEIIQDCLIFNTEINNKDKFMYKIKENKDRKIAERLANEWDYNIHKGRIPIGVIYREDKSSLEDKWPQLQKLKKKKRGWKKPVNIKKINKLIKKKKSRFNKFLKIPKTILKKIIS